MVPDVIVGDRDGISILCVAVMDKDKKQITHLIVLLLGNCSLIKSTHLLHPNTIILLYKFLKS